MAGPDKNGRCAYGGRSRNDPEVFPQRQWKGEHRRGGRRHAAALRAAQRSRPEQSAFRLRARPMRRLHRASRRPADPLLHHAGLGGGRQQGHDARRPRHAGQAASAADRLHRGTGAAMRLLHQWLDHDGGGVSPRQEEADRSGDQVGARRAEMPVRHAHGDPSCRQARSRDDGLREAVMTKHQNSSAFSRRAILKAGGALVVSIGAPIGFDVARAADNAMLAGTQPPLTPDQLSSYIAVKADGSVAAYFGKMDMGHGIGVAIGQIVAEELDVPFQAVKVFMADTATSVNQGGASGSTGIQDGGKQIRMAAAEARRVLVEMAARKFNTSADDLMVVDGVVQQKSNMDQTISYAELIGGRYFNVQLDWNKKYGNPLYAPGKAKPKDAKDHKIVGQPIKREDIAPKVFCQEDFCTDVKVPGMLHARMIRPDVAGAVPIKVDEASIKDIPGARVVWQDGFLAVLAPREWDAIQAMSKLTVEWSQAAPPF